MGAYPPINFQRQAPSRRRLRPGDIFTMHIADGRYLFGRVVRTDANCFAPGCILIYVFRHQSQDQVPPPRLLVRDLLIPPRLINRLGWSRGYLATVDSRPFEEGERLTRHFFRDSHGRYEDEDRRPTGAPPAGMPVGGAGLGNYRTLDDEVSAALGIPLAPDD